MPSHSGLLTVMERAARKAGQRLRRDFNEVAHLQVSRKGPADFVSKADKQAERTLFDELRKARPDWGFLLEEAGEIAGDPAKPRWIVDPLDGTTNFLHGIPHFAISMAVQEPSGEITTGLVYQPLTDESFWAEKGRGAWLQDQRLRVSSRRQLDEALIATGIPFKGHGDFAAWSRPRWRASDASARPRSTSPGSRRGGMTAIGKQGSSSGTWPRACCWFARRAGS